VSEAYDDKAEAFWLRYDFIAFCDGAAFQGNRPQSLFLPIKTIYKLSMVT
jgi:hypothetical protein